MLRLTSGWTEQHSSVALLLLLGSTASLAGLMDGGWVPVAVAAAVTLTALVSLSLDAWGGAVVGLTAAALVVAVRQSLDAWTTDDFGPASVTAAALLGVGAAAGATGRRLRSLTATNRGTRMDPLWEPAYGSLGLLGREATVMRLTEEVDRASRTGRPLSLALLDIHVVSDLTPDAHEAAIRATARLLEGRSREHDVPFALAADRLGVILPDATAPDAWDVVANVLSSMSSASYVDQQDRDAQPLAEVVELSVGIAQLKAYQDWQMLLDEAATAVHRATADSATTPAPERGEA